MAPFLTLDVGFRRAMMCEVLVLSEAAPLCARPPDAGHGGRRLPFLVVQADAPAVVGEVAEQVPRDKVVHLLRLAVPPRPADVVSFAHRYTPDASRSLAGRAPSNRGDVVPDAVHPRMWARRTAESPETSCLRRLAAWRGSSDILGSVCQGVPRHGGGRSLCEAERFRRGGSLSTALSPRFRAGRRVRWPA